MNGTLLNPEARLLNLPSTFNIPSYWPKVGEYVPHGPGHAENHVTVNLSVTSNASPDDIRRVALEGLSEALGRSRSVQYRGGGW